jgi:hypothetical protein
MRVLWRPIRGSEIARCFYWVFAGALRRSELVALDVAHLKLSDEGFIDDRQIQTDQEAQGQTIPIPRVTDSPYCPVQAVLDCG